MFRQHVILLLTGSARIGAICIIPDAGGLVIAHRNSGLGQSPTERFWVDREYGPARNAHTDPAPAHRTTNQKPGHPNPLAGGCSKCTPSRHARGRRSGQRLEAPARTGSTPARGRGAAPHRAANARNARPEGNGRWKRGAGGRQEAGGRGRSNQLVAVAPRATQPAKILPQRSASEPPRVASCRGSS